MKDVKITINGVAAPGFRLLIEGEGSGLKSWRVVGALTPNALAHAHTFALGSEVLIRAYWFDASGPHERVGWALFVSYEVGNELGDEFATFTGNGPLFAPVGRETHSVRLADELARARQRIAELVKLADANVMPAPHINDVRTALAVALIGAYSAGPTTVPLDAVSARAREMADRLIREDGAACPASGAIPNGEESAQQSCDSREPATDAGTGALPT